MARVERYTSTEPVPVEQAQLIDPSAFRFSTAGAETLKQIGGVLEEIGRRKVEMQDRIGISNINATIENAEREYQKEIIGKPLEDHAAILQKHRNNAMALAGKQRLSPDTRTLADNKLQIWGDTFADASELATIKTLERDAIIRVTDDYEKALTEGIREDIAEAEIALDEQFKISYAPAEARVLKEKAEQRAIQQMEENAKQAQMDIAAVNPSQITTPDGKGTIDIELKARGKGKNPSQEFALLSNTDLETIRDYANSVGKKAQTDSEIAFNQAVEDSYAKIISGDTDITSMITAIQTNPTISEEDSTKASDKIVTFFSKWNTILKPDSSDNSTYLDLLEKSALVERGAISPVEFDETLATAKSEGKLSEADQRDLLSKDIVATKTMQNRAFSDAMIITRPRLVEATESELASIKLARTNAELLKDIKSINLFNIALKKNQAQNWNLGRFRKELRSQISQNENWSQKQIFTAQEILANNLDIEDGELLKQFDKANPQKTILKTPPDDEFQDIWKDLSQEDRATIWELKMRGASNREIIGALPK